jgi:transcriptional regulator with XRE-family HTH domain
VSLERLGATLHAYRHQCGLTQAVLAVKTGLHRTYIGRRERGLYDPSLLNLHRIAQGLHVPLSRLVQPLDAPPPPAEEPSFR